MGVHGAVVKHVEDKGKEDKQLEYKGPPEEYQNIPASFGQEVPYCMEGRRKDNEEYGDVAHIIPLLQQKGFPAVKLKDPGSFSQMLHKINDIGLAS
jgi:hypothetical protein